MKKAGVLLAGAFGLLMSSAAFAEGYWGINYAMPEQDDRFFGEETFDTGEVFFRLGGDINDIFSAEIRAGATVSPKEEDDVTFEHNYLIGGFVRADHEMGMFKPYVLLGLIRGEETLKTNVATYTDGFDDIAGGVGVDMQFGQALGLNLEYTHYYDIGDVTLRGPSAGIYWKF
jgi:hypothetical protein